MRFFITFTACLMLGFLAFCTHSGMPAQISDDPDLTLPAFAGCTSDQDCKLVALPCGEIGAAKQSQHRYVQDWYNDVMTRMRCPMPEVKSAAPHTAACVNNICVAKPGTPEPAHVP